VLTPRGLVRYLALFVIDLRTRTVEIAGIVRAPATDFMKQMARNHAECLAKIIPLGERHL